MHPLAASGKDSVGTTAVGPDPPLKHGCGGARTSMTKDNIIKSQQGGACVYDALASI